jgi:hypothetical protein
MKVIHLVAIGTCETYINKRVKSAQEVDEFIKTVKTHLEQDPIGLKYDGYQLMSDGVLTYKGKMYIPNCDDFKRLILYELHKRPYVDHPGYLKMIASLRKLFYWQRMKEDIIDYLDKCLECQQVKVEHHHPIGLLHPLTILEWKWETISMEFIIGLPKTSKQNDVFYHINCRLGKF